MQQIRLFLINVVQLGRKYSAEPQWSRWISGLGRKLESRLGVMSLLRFLMRSLTKLRGDPDIQNLFCMSSCDLLCMYSCGNNFHTNCI